MCSCLMERPWCCPQERSQTPPTCLTRASHSVDILRRYAIVQGSGEDLGIFGHCGGGGGGTIILTWQAKKTGSSANTKVITSGQNELTSKKKKKEGGGGSSANTKVINELTKKPNNNWYNTVKPICQGRECHAPLPPGSANGGGHSYIQIKCVNYVPEL